MKTTYQTVRGKELEDGDIFTKALQADGRESFQVVTTNPELIAKSRLTGETSKFNKMDLYIFLRKFDPSENIQKFNQ